MKFVSGVAITLLLALAWQPTLFAQQRQFTAPIVDKASLSPKLDIEVLSPGSKSRRSNPPNIQGQKLIDQMANGFTSSNNGTNQIAFDPATNKLIVVYRGKRATHNDGVGELVLNTSDNFGATWSGESATINVGVPNSSGQLVARHPSLDVYNNGSLNVATLWSNLDGSGGSFSDIGFAAGVLGGLYTKGLWGPTPPDYYIATRITVNPTNGKMYALIDGVDPATLNFLGEMYLTTSTDFGKSWSVNVGNPVVLEPLPGDYRTARPGAAMDISPDGSTIGIAFAAFDASNLYANALLGYMQSTDDGASWSSPKLTSPADFKYVNLTGTEVIPEFWQYSDVALAMDSNNKPHILETMVFRDQNQNINATWIGEVTFNGNDVEFFGLSSVRGGQNPHWLTTPSTTPGTQNVNRYYTEPEFSKSVDGNKIYAKWIDLPVDWIDSTFTVIRDSTRDVFIAARDIRSTGPLRGWEGPVNVTNSANNYEKHTKMARTVGSDGRLNIIYTRFGAGEFVPGQDVPDSENLTACDLYYITDVVLGEPTLDIDLTATPGDFTLAQNYPNPFNPSTTISFTLPQATNVKLIVTNVLGQKVATLINGRMEAGQYNKVFNAGNLPSGIYLYRLETGSQIATRKMMLMK